MDGVLTDFVGEVLRLFERPEVLERWPPAVWDIERVLGVSRRCLWTRIGEQGEAFWENLQPYPWAKELVKLVREIAPLTILSSPSQQPASLSGKLKWLHKHFGPGFRDFLLGPPKHLCARPDVVLIDDSDDNVHMFRRCGGKAVLFPQPWNSNHELVTDRLSYVRQELQRLSKEEPESDNTTCPLLET